MGLIMMLSLRKLLFLLHIIIGQWIAWGLIWLLGKLHIWRVLFVIYPHNANEYSKLSWNWPILQKIMSGRPVPAGIIIDGKKPIGVYFLISNTLELLHKKSNKIIAKKIAKMMKWALRLSGAQVVGFAGGLGQILQKRHNINMIHPFYDSTQGNIYAISQYIYCLVSKNDEVAIIGGGPLGKKLKEYIPLKSRIIPVKYRRRQGYILADETLPQCDCYVNLLPTGQDFTNLRLNIPQHAVIVDFSRPPIPVKYHDNITKANRVTRPNWRFFNHNIMTDSPAQELNTRFWPTLPGGWQRHELPACSLPCLLAAYGDLSAVENQHDFNTIARYMRFHPIFKRGNHA